MDLDDLIQTVTSYTHTQDVEYILTEAYQIASDAHRGFQRATGEPFLSHAFKVAKILAEWHAPPSLVAIGLLHDIHSPEYSSEYDLDAVERRLGPEIFRSLQATIQLNGLFRYIEKDFARYADVNGIGNHMALILQQEPDLTAIKIVDRLHNLQTISSLTRGFQERAARIGFNLLVPLAEKLGMASVKNQLEDYSFEIIHPTYYQMLKLHYMKINHQEISDIAENLQAVIHKIIPNCEVRWSPSSLYTLYWHQVEHNVKLGKPINAEFPPIGLVDAGVFVVLTDDEIDCYRIMGILHKLYQPVERHFHDYIGSRKDNGYQSLHTQIKYSAGNLLNLCIRTHTMHLVAERGITARWWNVPEEFLPQLPKEILLEGKEIQVFTSIGETKNMPIRSTLLDFAYEIHTDIGHRCIGGLVNGEHAELHYPLKAGDRVELMLGGAEVEPRLESLSYVQTSQAANRIRQWFTLHRRLEMIERGQALLEKQLRLIGFDIGDAQLRQLLTQLALKEHFNTWEDQLVSIGVGRHKAPKIVAQLQSITSPQQTITVAVHALAPKEDALTKIYAKCCNPVMPDDIIGCLDHHGKERVLIIHDRECSQVKVGKEVVIVPVKWDDEPAESNYVVVVEALDRKGLAADLTKAITLLECSMQEFKTHRRPVGIMAEAQILLGKSTEAQRTRIQEELTKVAYVTHVELILSSELPPSTQQPVAQLLVHKPNPYGPKLALGPRFYGREIECQRISALLHNQSQNTAILLWGQKRIGKSSLLLHLNEHANSDFVPIFVDVQGVSDSTTTHFLRHLMLRITDVLKEKFPELAQDVTVPHLKRLRRDPLALFDTFLLFIQEHIQNHHIVLILDEFQCLWNLQELEVTRKAIFSRLRSNSQHGHGVHLILSGGGLLSQLTRHSGIAALFNTAYDVKLDCLGLDAASQLIRDGLTKVGAITDDAVQYLLSITAGHPFYLQLLCWRLYELAQESNTAITSEFTSAFVQGWLSKADSSRFQHLWEADTLVSTQKNKVILSALAQLGCNTCEIEYNHLASLIYPVISEQNLLQTLEDLTNLGILKHNHMHYAIAVELFACWLRQHWPLELVLKEAPLL